MTTRLAELGNPVVESLEVIGGREHIPQVTGRAAFLARPR